MISADGGFNAYADEASQINNNLQRFRSDVDSANIANKEIKQSFQAKTDLDNLRNMAGELGAKNVKDVLAKAGKYLYDTKIGGKTLRQRDIESSFDSKDIEEKLSNFGKKKVQDFTDFLDRQKQLNEDRRQFQKTESFLKERTGTNTSETIGNKSVYNSITDEDLDIDPHPTRVENPDAEPSRPSPMENESNELRDTGEGIGKMEDAPTEIRSTELPEGVNTLDDGVKGAIDTANTSVSDTITSAGTTSGETITNAVKDAGKGAEKSLTDEAEKIGTSLTDEAVGAVLDETGIGAVVGIPLQIAGLVADGGLLYEAGKSLVNWFDEDILGHKPKVPQNQLVKTPTRPLTLAERHLGVIPNVDTIDTQPSYAGGW